MLLSSLRLHEFRSYGQVLLTPPPGVTVLAGKNGTGKTNLLEAVHLCCLGRSHRTSQDRDMIMHEKESAAVQVTVQRRDGEHQVGVRLYENARRKKLIYVNGKIVPRMGELIGHATCVMFSPEDLQLVKDGPQARRRFLDMLLSQDQRSYFYALQNYNNALKQRNALLKSLQAGGDPRQLDAWDEQLALCSAPIVRMRRETVEEMKKQATSHYTYIAGKNEEHFDLRYVSQVADAENVSEKLLKLLKESRAEDLRRVTTTRGPHRDDVELYLNERELKSFGSQGQIRTAVLSLRLASFDLLTKHQGETPLLLLDDVLSELDATRREKLIERVSGAQVLLTCTDISDLSEAKPACVLRVMNGGLIQQ
ncbi:MAG: DNA replication/repair protein RecF [Clostridiales bacterium]|nr:DNA replication/repair protein RecF [Clostridiales bacterium]